MAFDKLPGHNLQIPQVNYHAQPGKHVVPTGEMVASAVQQLAKIAEQFSPYEKEKKALELATLRGKSNWLQRFGLMTPEMVMRQQIDAQKYPQSQWSFGQGRSSAMTPAMGKSLMGQASQIDPSGIGGNFNTLRPTLPAQNPTAPPITTEPIVAPDQRGRPAPDTSTPLMPPPIAVAIPDDAQGNPVYKKAYENSIKAGYNPEEASQKAFEVYKTITNASSSDLSNASLFGEPDTTPEEYYA